MTKAPLAIVWACRLSVAEYVAAGRGVEPPGLACPDCGVRLAPWSGYERWLRVGADERRVWIRRGRCPACRRTHALLPDLVLARRLDPVEVIGDALARAIAGAGARRVALALGLPHTTVRDWRRRHRARAPAILAHVGAVAVSLGADLADLPGSVEAAALAALDALGERLRRRRPGAVPERWRLWALVCGGWPLASNRAPPLARAGPAAWMA